MYKVDNYPPPTFSLHDFTQTIQWSSLAPQHSTSSSDFYPTKSPLMATLIIIEVALLMAAAFSGLYLMTNFILYFGILVVIALCESDNACGMFAVIKRKAKEM